MAWDCFTSYSGFTQIMKKTSSKMISGSFISPPRSNSDHFRLPIANRCYRYTLVHKYGIVYGLSKDHVTRKIFLALNLQTFYQKFYL